MITFLGMSSRTSGEIRGRQIAEAIGGTANFTDVHYPNPNLYINDIVLFVRTYESNIAKHLKSIGKKIGYEIADMPVGDAVFRQAEVKDLSAYVHKECDFFVVNNSVQKQDLSAITNKPIFVIPHHSTNYENTKNEFRDPPKVVGYVGLPEQLSNKQNIENLCNQFGCSFISVHPNTREECDKIFRQIDVGIVFAESDSTMRPRVVELMKRYKPNTKLSNFQAYGIPSIVTRYTSYEEFGHRGFIFADNANELENNLINLLSNSDYRKLLSEQSFENGKLFHIEQIKNYYMKMVNSL